MGQRLGFASAPSSCSYGLAQLPLDAPGVGAAAAGVAAGAVGTAAGAATGAAGAAAGATGATPITCTCVGFALMACRAFLPIVPLAFRVCRAFA